MASNKKYLHRSRLSDEKFRELVRYFSLDIEAKKTAVLTRLNRNTINRYYLLLRKCIAEFCERNNSLAGGKVVNPLDVDGAKGYDCLAEGKSKARLLGICVLDGKVHIEILLDERIAAAQAFISGNCPNPDEFSQCRQYDGLVAMDCGRYRRVGGGPIACNEHQGSIKTSEVFWGFAKSRLMKFNGIRDSVLYLHLKECEFRFNYRNQDIYRILLKMVRGEG